VGWALLEEECAAVRLAMRDAMHCTEQTAEGTLFGLEVVQGENPENPLSEWMLTQACFDLLCQQIRGSYTAERFRACLPQLQRFLCSGHRSRPHLYTQVCHWLGVPVTVPESEAPAMTV
jgi:hypothetical protein